MDSATSGKERAMKTVSDLLRAKPARLVSIRPDASVLDAIKLLAQEDIGAAIVMEGDRLAGIFSERDYTRKVILQGRSSNTTRVDEIMTKSVITVNPRTRTRECMQLMTEKQIRHLPVLDDKRVVGMVSIRDIVGDIIADQDFTIEQLEHYISGQ
jgi:CBS domain-containing protein